MEKDFRIKFSDTRTGFLLMRYEVSNGYRSGLAVIKIDKDSLKNIKLARILYNIGMPKIKGFYSIELFCNRTSIKFLPKKVDFEKYGLDTFHEKNLRDDIGVWHIHRPPKCFLKNVIPIHSVKMTLEQYDIVIKGDSFGSDTSLFVTVPYEFVGLN